MGVKKFLISTYLKFLNKVSMGHGYGKKYRIVKLLQKKIESTLKSNYVEVWAGKMYLHPNDGLGLSIRGEYGPFDTNIVKKYVKKGDIVLDIGAHIGYFTLIFAKLVGDKGKVFAFEPDPRNFIKLKKNVEINGYNNVELVNKAVSNVNEWCTLYTGQQTFGANRIYKPNKTNTQLFIPINCQTIVLDDYFKELNLIDKINFIKMDIEGAEMLALKGMTIILKSNKNLKIFTELSKNSLEDAGSSSEEMLQFLCNHGFKIFYSDNKKNTLNPNQEFLKKIICDEKTVNLFCIR